MEQNKQNKENKKDKKLANRILYISVAAVVCVGVLIGVIALTATGGDPVVNTPPVDEEPDSPTGTTPVDPSTILPDFVSPAVGIIGMSHDLDMPVYSKTMDDWRVHRGIDITASAGDKVMAAADGVVESISDDPLYGKTVVITHNGGAKTIYSNLAADLAEGIEAGKSVKCGDLIGSIGDTATLELAEEPHLHFEMTVNGVSVDPMDYISEDSASASLGADVGYEG